MVARNAIGDSADSQTISIPIPAEIKSGQSTYLFEIDYANKKNWNDAEAECVVWGGHLLAVNNEDEQTTIESLLQENGW